MKRRERQKNNTQVARIEGAQSASDWGAEPVMHSLEISSYSGPLPHPDTLRSFEEIVPGAAQRIFTQFEEQSSHRRKMEATVISSGAFSQRLGTISSALVGVIGVSGGIWLTHEGKDLEGLGTAFGTLAALVGAYLYKKRQQNQELSDKRPKAIKER